MTFSDAPTILAMADHGSFATPKQTSYEIAYPPSCVGSVLPPAPFNLENPMARIETVSKRPEPQCPQHPGAKTYVTMIPKRDRKGTGSTIMAWVCPVCSKTVETSPKT